MYLNMSDFNLLQDNYPLAKYMYSNMSDFNLLQDNYPLAKYMYFNLLQDNYPLAKANFIKIQNIPEIKKYLDTRKPGNPPGL